MGIPTGMVQGGATLAILSLIAVWEAMAPALRQPPGVLRRRIRNFAIGGSGILLTHAIPGASLLAVSAWGRSMEFGLLAGLSAPWDLIATTLILDLAVWAQHRASHAWPWLWRLHRVHHGDTALDLSTAFRFHPLELGVSLAWKAIVVLLLGGPTVGVLVFEGLLQAGNLFEHANVRLPASVDRILPWVLVTPRIHALHHSTDHRDQRSNYGFFLSLWDRLFHSFRVQPLGGGPLILGLGEGMDQSLLGMLRNPFEPTPSSDPER